MQSESSNEINDFSVLLKIKYIKDKPNPWYVKLFLSTPLFTL